MKHARITYLCATTMAGALAVAGAQAPTPNLEFEVASIRLQAPDAPPGPAAATRPGVQPGRIFSHGGSIRALLQRAYGLPYVQQTGGPSWIAEDTYIVRAVAPEDVPLTPENVTVMVRALLEDRFKLVAREETREIPIYALIHARTDRTPGPGLRLSPADCQERRSAARQNGQPSPDDCGSNVSMLRNRIRVRGMTIASVANTLQLAVRRPVVDRTGLGGSYNFDLNFAEQGDPPDVNLPSFFTAIQEQLGLKLESDEAPMKVLVIDSIARPTEN